MHFSFKNGMDARRRSGHRPWAITGGLPILAATMACSIFSGGPEPTTSPSSSPQAKPSPTSPRTMSAAEIVEAAAPSTIGGLPLTSLVVTGADLVANQPELAEVFAQAGIDPGEVDAAVRAAPPEAGVHYRIGAITWPGANWGSVLVADIAAEAAQAGMTIERVDVAGRQALRLGMEDAGPAGEIEVAAGDSLVFIQSADEAALESSVGSLPDETGDAEPPPILPGRNPLALAMLQRPIPPVCVGEPPGRQWIQVMAIDAGLGVPSPYNVFTLSGILGPSTPAPQAGPVSYFPYTTDHFGGGLEQLTIEARSILGGYGQLPLDFPVQHCLWGMWLDEDRVLRITPPKSDNFTAEVMSGTICQESGGIAFSGTVDRDRVSGSDLKACNPQECVDAGLLPKSVLLPYQGTIADDGQSVTINWEGPFYTIEYGESGAATRCTETRSDSNSFSITRQSWE